MKRSISTIVCLAVAACGTAPQPLDPQTQAELENARELLSAGDFDEALLITDELLAKNSDNRDALVLAAQGNLALFESGRQGQQYFLEDAVGNFERALEIDDSDADTWLQLADLYLKKSQFDDGEEAALTAASLLADAKAEPDAIARAVLAAAENQMQAFVASRREEMAAGEEQPKPETFDQASAVLSRLAAAKAALPGLAYAKSAQVYQWLGQDTKALDEYERGIEQVPGDQVLNDGFQSLYQGMGRQLECVAAYKRLLVTQPGNTLLLWHLGRAQFALADDQRTKGRVEAAIGSYAAAAESFGRYRSLRPEHNAATDQWLAICNLSRAKLSLDAGDSDAALQFVHAAYDNTPRVAEFDDAGYPVLFDASNAHFLGLIDQIGRSIISGSNVRALEDGLAYFESVIERYPDRFGFVYNNAALAARDLGAAYSARSTRGSVTDDERTNLQEQAQQLWERSYEHYEKAVALSPDDPRIVNDCGLMLIYHLFRKYDRARELFDRAIEVGQPQLDAVAADDDSQRQFLEEAVGDAYQNIGVLMRMQDKPFAEYEPFLTKAVEYYPYRRRAAAALLRVKGSDEVAIPGLPNPPGRTAEKEGGGQQASAIERVRTESEAKAAAGDYDGALLVLDSAPELRGQPEYHRLFGKYSLAYAKQAIDDGQRASLIDGLFADAISQLERAVELASEPIEPRVELTQAYYDSGDFASAADEADSLLSHIRSLGGAAETHLAQAHSVRARAHARVFIAATQDGAESQDNLRSARNSFEQLVERKALDNTLVQTWTSLEQWAGNQDRAMGILRVALAQQPESTFLLDQLVETAAAQEQLVAAVEALADRSDAPAQWYRGKARFLNSQQEWRNGKPAEALQTLDLAIADFEAAKQLEASYATSCDEWLAYCLGCRGVIRLGQDDSGRAAKDFLAAAKRAPTALANDLGNGYTIKRGILTLGGRFMSANDLGRAEALFRRATEAAPEDPDFANNHGLFARDHGVGLEQSGKEQEAAAMFEASYASYTRAAELQPENVRFINDRALLLIYHLHRDLDQAHELLQQAIALGEKRMAESPPEDPAARRDLEESIGDCYQNLGVYQELHGDDPVAAEASYRKSLEFYPHGMRDSSRHLDRLERRQAEADAAPTSRPSQGADGR